MQGQVLFQAALHQPGAQGVGRLSQVHSRPAEDQQVTGAGAGHIGQTFGFRRLGPLILLGCSSSLPPVGIEVKVQVGVSLRRWHPTASELAGTGLDRFAAFPEKGADHHGIFQPLAAVHGHHGDG